MSKPGSVSKPWRGAVNARLIKVRSVSNETVPIFGLVAMPGGVEHPVSGSPRTWLDVEAPQADGAEALFVNGRKALSPASPYGAVMSVTSGPLWIAYDDAETPAEGDEWGPVEDSFRLSADGEGFKILQVDAERKLVRAVFLFGGKCPHVVEFFIDGHATSGDADLTVQFNSVSENVTIGYNMTASEVRTALAGHSEISAAGGTSLMTAQAGPLPHDIVYITFHEDLERAVRFGAIANNFANFAQLRLRASRNSP